MANENKNIKELVSEDDDPTAELEIPGFRQHDSAACEEESESESHTHGLGNGKKSDSTTGQTIPELQSDLESRARTIGKLQYDIEQLRAKWLGLEAEIAAREEIADTLLQDAEKLKKTISRKDNLLKKRNESINALKATIKERDEDLKALEEDLEKQRSVDAENAAALDKANRELEDLLSKLEVAGTEIVSLETTVKQRDEAIELLEQKLDEQQSAGAEHMAALEEARNELQGVRAELAHAVREELNLNKEINQRDELESLLEEKNASLELQLSEQIEKDAEHLAALEDARKEVALLTRELETTRKQSATEIARTQKTTSTAVSELREQLKKTEEYADTLRHKFQDLNESVSGVSNDRDALKKLTAQLTADIDDLSAQLQSEKESNTELRATIDQLQSDHEAEIRALRLDLGEAQDTLSQTGDLNSQLASELVDARGYKEELERMLTKSAGESQDRIAKLEKKIKALTSEAEEFENKLDTKNTAINVLLGELSKKTEQIESIGDIEDVIHEIDSRMSERFDEGTSESAKQKDAGPAGGERDRITRVLVGSVGDQELRFPLFKKRLTIGRTAENDIQLKTAYISRRHAVVVTEGDAARIIDWGSKNGVYVNSKRVKEQVLSNGDIVSVGNAKFRYEERPKRDS